MSNRKYTKEEDAYIVEHFYTATAKEIAARLARTVKSIRSRAIKLGLSPKMVLRRWTKEENEFIKNRGNKKLAEVAKLLNRDQSEVSEHATKLGVPFRREYRVSPRGYARIQIRKGNGIRQTVWQHRQVMEDTIGRPLQRGEVVHHINCDKLDNRPENLYLCDSLKSHRQLHAAIEMLIPQLMASGVVVFDRENGTYKLNGGQSMPLMSPS